MNVIDSAIFVVVKMGVLGEVWAIACRFALEVNLFDEVALDEGIEAVIDGRERYRRHFLFGAGEYFVGCGVVALGEYGIVNDLTLSRGTKAGSGKLLVQDLCSNFVVHWIRVLIWNNSKSQYRNGIILNIK